jgi:hypothetical protein
MASPTAPVGRRVRAILIAAVIVVGSVAGAEIVLLESTPGHVAIVSDGPTLYQSLAAVNASVVDELGGPWSLFSLFGVAAQVPFSANVLPYGSSVNGTVNVCGKAFDGLTLWNGSLPTFDGSFSSGTAPFWQFAYFSNVSQQILVATDVLGVVHAYAPVPVSGPCRPWYDLDDPTPSFWTADLASFPANSPGAARTALQSLGGAAPSGALPWVEIYASGPGFFGPLGDLPKQLGIYFDRCGEENVSGIQPLLAVTEGLGGQYQGAAELNETCALLSSGHGAYDGVYALQPSTPELTSGPSAQWFTIPFQVALAYPNGTLTGDYDGWGLANWMANFQLTNRTGAVLPTATPTCPRWQASLQGCPANTSGWFAVVVSASGEWINSFGELVTGQDGWSVPVTALVSNQQLVVVVPVEWDPTGDSLSVSSAVSTSTVEATIEL